MKCEKLKKVHDMMMQVCITSFQKYTVSERRISTPYGNTISLSVLLKWENNIKWPRNSNCELKQNEMLGKWFKSFNLVYIIFYDYKGDILSKIWKVKVYV